MIWMLCQSQTFWARPKDDFHRLNSVFVPAQNFLEGHYNSIQFVVWPKIFGPCQKILGPVEGQGISNKKKQKANNRIVKF